MVTGVLDLPWWGYVIYTLVLTHITIAAVTIFLHRHQAHRALDLHPLPSHFFRFWLWITTGMVTKEWTAVHRKHHAKCESEDDPHSPQIAGINKVIDLVLFGFIGLTIWAVQMLWIPFFAAGVINGIGHYWGYRNFQPEDASRNIVPWGILVGGEELHNNHHAYASSARLSNRWFEFDIGWLYIRMLETVGLAQVKKVAPKVRLVAAKAQCDLATVQAVVTHRYEVLAKYAKTLRRTCAAEMRALRARAVSVDRATLKRWLHIDARALPTVERARMNEVLSKSSVLNTVYTMRQELAALWQRSSASKEQLVSHLEDWCRRAEASGIAALQEFSRQLRCYA